MKSPSLAVSAVVCAAALVGPPLVQGQGLPRDPAERARVIAQVLEANARQLTLFDRSGQAVGTVGLRDLWAQPVFSPDATKLIVLAANTGALRVWDLRALRTGLQPMGMDHDWPVR